MKNSCLPVRVGNFYLTLDFYLIVIYNYIVIKTKDNKKRKTKNE